MQTSRMIGVVAVAAMAAYGGCDVVDDEPTVTGDAGGDTGDGIEPACKDAAEDVHDCRYPMQWWLKSDGAEGRMILADDPEASVEVGPNAWLVQVSSKADYVATHEYKEGPCDAHCGWCGEGQHLCHGGFDENLMPRCWSCIGLGVSNPGEECAKAMEKACDRTIVEPGEDTADGSGAYDCTAWRPEERVRRDGSTITVDAGLLKEALLYAGEPLASCDDTRFHRRSDGYYEVSRLGDRGLLVEMGLARGDVLVALDGEPVGDFDALVQAASRLTTAASFTVTVERGDQRFDMKVSVR